MKNKKEEKLAQSPPLSSEKKGQIPDQILHELRAEGSLQNSESFLNSIIDQSPYPMWISDAQGTLIRLNQALRDLLNISNEDVVGKYNVLKDNIVEEQGFLPLVKRVFEEGETARFELRYDSSQLQHLQLRHFAFVILDVSVFPIRDVSGSITNAVIQHMDITERKQIEKALCTSEERYRDLVENSHDLICTHDLEGNLLSVNEAPVRRLGYSRESLLHMNPRDLLATEQRDKFEVYLKEIQEKGRASGILRIQTASGETRYWEYNNTLRTEGVAVPIVRGMAHDITERRKVELALRESEKKYRLVVDNMADNISVMDMNLRFTYVSPSIMRLRGYTSEEVMAQTLEQVVTPESLQTINKVFEEEMKLEASGAADPRRSRILELEEYRKDGSTVWIENHLSFMRDEAQKPVSIISLSRDITDRKQAEQALQESEKRYRELYDFLPIPVYEMDFEANITSANRAIYETFRGTEEDLKKGFKGWQLLSSEEVEKSSKNIERLLKGEQIEGTEYTFKRLDGSVFPAIVISSVIYSNDKPVGLRGAVVDITERRQAEEKLRERDERYKALFDGSLDLVYVTDFEGRFIDANAAALNRLGYTREEIRSLNFASLLNEEQLSLALKILQDVRKPGIGMGLVEFRLRHKNGSEVYVETHGSTVMSNGTPVAIQAIARDITERKKVEEKLNQTLENLRKALGGIIQVISGTVETKDPYTAGHQRRVSDLARAIAQEMGLAESQREGLRMAGTIHDLGKISVPAEILSKPTKLTEIEYKLIQAHSQIGYDILKGIEFPWPIADMVLQHHERMNGSGYPQGLKGEAISREARILMVADVVEAMASYRPYRPALGVDAALEEVEKNKGILYDPEVVEVCLRLFREKGFGFE